MNKGFAVLAEFFAQDRDCCLKCISVDAFEISSLVVIAEIAVCFDWQRYLSDTRKRAAEIGIT
jgi:hypothetical protein